MKLRRAFPQVLTAQDHVTIAWTQASPHRREPTLVSGAPRVGLRALTLAHAGDARARSAVLVASGALKLTNCTVSSSGCGGVVVAGGARLHATQSYVGPCAGDGVLVEGYGARAELADCRVHDARECGVLAAGGARVGLLRCHLERHLGRGVLVAGPGARLDVVQSVFHDNREHLVVDDPAFRRGRGAGDVNVNPHDDALDGAAVAVAAKLNTVKASARTYLQKKGKHGGVDQSGALFDALM